jgi:hypothetical protein
VVGRTGLADGLDRAEEFAEPEGRAVPLLSGALGCDGVAAGVLVADALVADALGGAEVAWPECCAAEPGPVAAVADGWVSGEVAGLNVATDSMVPATRQTARMLASSGITVPRPANGAVSFRSRLRRRWTRSSRW